MMKKLFLFASLVFFCFACFACVTPSGNSNSVVESKIESQQSEESYESVKKECVHDVVKMVAKEATCTTTGSIEFYFCWKCKEYFADENAEIKITQEDTQTPLAPHDATHCEEVSPTCGENGTVEHWVCNDCGSTFSDEDCTQRIWGEELVIPSLEHKNMVHREGYAVDGNKNGLLEHWYCEDCDGYFRDSQGQERITKKETVLLSAINIPDFLVEIPSGKDMVLLHLTDTQIIDGAQSRPDASSGDKITYAPEKIPTYCYDYITEMVNSVKPDLIILTGDIVYGKYDDNGSALVNFIAFMEEFKIPWAPVFGNHDNESKMGADWQCEQLEKAEYCLFKQGDLTGNGNYSVGIVQDGQLKRVFYMLDTNGCTEASDESIKNGHTLKSVGFGDDQVKWYTEQIQQIKELSPKTDFSFAFHIQLAVFGEALSKYGFDSNTKYHEIYIDYLSTKDSGEFGYIGRQMKDAWDSSRRIFNGLKELGVDSIFVGHEHCNSASVVFEGVRLQYGQKSSEYDRYNTVSEEGKIIETAIWKKTGTPLVGGSVVVFSASRGEIVGAYIYYCNDANKLVDSKYYS